MVAPRCGCAFRRGVNAPVKLMTNRPLVFFQEFLTKTMTVEQFVERMMAGLNLWSVVCDIKFERTSDVDKAHIVVKTETIDGPGETLAYAYFPSGARLQLPLVMGAEEAWDTEFGPQLMTTSCHEGGHNCGVDHDPTGQGVMAAFYNPKVLKPTSSWEIGQMQSRYGKPLTVTPTQPTTPGTTPSTPGLDVIDIRVQGTNLKVLGFEHVK